MTGLYINLKHIHFNLVYRTQDDGLWKLTVDNLKSGANDDKDNDIEEKPRVSLYYITNVESEEKQIYYLYKWL